MCVLCGDHEAVHLTAEPATALDYAPPVVSVDQAIYQLTTQWVGAEGTTRTWNASTVYYSMPDSSPNYSSMESSGFRPMSPVMKDAARTSFELWDDLVAINLVETTSPTANITFAYSSSTSGGGTYAMSRISGYGPNYSMASARIWLNSSWSSHDTDADMVYGGYGYITYIHEIGHALGLSHPGTYNGSATWSQAEYAQDTRQFTVMSYFDADEGGAAVDHYGQNGQWKYASTPMLHDVAAIQAKYGADMTTRTGDTTYGFNFTADKSVFNFLVNKDPIICIWDAGGNDTLDVSGYTTNQRIDLRAGTYSDIGYMTQNVAIAYGCLIENGYGGSGSDSILGNDIGNILKGNAGHDILTGGKGNDTLDGGTGNDLFKFGFGDGHDTVTGFVAGGTEDRLEITGYTSAILKQEGADTRVELDASNSVLLKNVQATSLTASDLNISFSVGGTTPPPPPPTSGAINGTAGADILNGTDAGDTINGLAGNDYLSGGLGDDFVYGGDGADTLRGQGGNDTLDGGKGDDAHAGGAGADTFVFNGLGFGADRISDFQNGLDKIKLTGIAGIDSFSDLTITAYSGGSIITLPDGSTIKLGSISTGQLDASDFIFGP